MIKAKDCQCILTSRDVLKNTQVRKRSQEPYPRGLFHLIDPLPSPLLNEMTNKKTTYDKQLCVQAGSSVCFPNAYRRLTWNINETIASDLSYSAMHSAPAYSTTELTLSTSSRKTMNCFIGIPIHSVISMHSWLLQMNFQSSKPTNAEATYVQSTRMQRFLKPN